MNITAERINEIKGNMSQKDFARSVNTTQSTISKVLSGDAPSQNLLTDIAKTYHVSIDWLLGISTRKPLYGYSMYDEKKTITYSDVITILVRLMQNHSLCYETPQNETFEETYNPFYNENTNPTGKIIICDRYINEMASVADTLVKSSPESLETWLKKISEDYETELLKWDSSEECLYNNQRNYRSSLEILNARKHDIAEKQ